MSATDASPVAEVLAAFGKLKVHDVSPVIGPETPVWFMHPAPEIIPTLTHAEVGAATNVIKISEHTGTHVDAPFHFDPNGITVDEIAADALLLRPFHKYDLKANDYQAGDLVSLQDIQAAERAGDFTLSEGDVAIIEFGWDRQLPGGEAGRDDDFWSSNEPGLSPEACDYLAASKPVAVACDTAACDVAAKDGELMAAHGHTQAFLPAGILIVEALRGLAVVPDSGLFLALPLKIKGGTASPVRVLLLTD